MSKVWYNTNMADQNRHTNYCSDDFAGLTAVVQEAGRMAAREQLKAGGYLKSDGSIVTQADLTVQRMLVSEIEARFPGAGVVGEESRGQDTDSREPDTAKELTFVIDPIDGTDGYSQGLPGWCVGVGILDRKYEPIGGIVYAPNWNIGNPGNDDRNPKGVREGITTGGMLFTDLPGQGLTLNGAPYRPPCCLHSFPEVLNNTSSELPSAAYSETAFESRAETFHVPEKKDPEKKDPEKEGLNHKLHKRDQLMVGSKLHTHFSFATYPGKVRSIGSSILHLLSPLIHPRTGGTLLTPCYIWDIAPAHSFLIHGGLTIETFSKKPFSYHHMVKGALTPDYIFAGFPETIELMRRHFQPLK